jgi:methionyl-tRNA formyltransferase
MALSRPRTPSGRRARASLLELRASDFAARFTVSLPHRFTHNAARMKIVFLATGDFAVPSLRAIVKAGHTVAHAISQPDRPAGRGRAVEPTPVHAAADALGIPHHQAENVNTPEFVALASEADLGVVVAFGQKLGPELLAAPKRGFINLHGSLLPKYRGAAPYQWAVLNGDAESGVTTFQLNEKWDAGAIWGAKSTPIGSTETADELHDRLAILGADLMLETLQRIEAGEAPQPQNSALATRAPKLSKADGLLDWSQPADFLVRRILGLWSWPAAAAEFISHRGKRERVQFVRAQIADPDLPPDDSFPPGAIRADGTVQTGRGTIRILEIRPAGKPTMPFDAFARGRSVAPPDRFIRPDA